MFTVTLQDAEGTRSWVCDDWETAYADARAESGLGARAVGVSDASGRARYSWVAEGFAVEPARVHAMTYRYSPRVAS